MHRQCWGNLIQRPQSPRDNSGLSRPMCSTGLQMEGRGWASRNSSLDSACLFPQHRPWLPLSQADNHSICPMYIGPSGVATGILWKPFQVKRSRQTSTPSPAASQVELPVPSSPVPFSTVSENWK